MKLFTAGVATETNTFSPMPTGLSHYAESLLAPKGVPDDAPAAAQPLVVWRRRAREQGWQLAEGLYASAQPAGLTVRTVYEGFREEIVTALRAALPVDAVLLCLHGAMVADGYDDCEGDLLQHVRGVVGPDVKVGAELDPHCHLTRLMLEHADAIVCYKEYPHTDQAARAEELFDLIAGALAGKTALRMDTFDCRMISNFFTTTQPMKGFLDQVRSLEGKDGVLSISVAHGFPWGDVPEMGTRMLVVTDNQPERGAALAKELGQQLIALRGRTHEPYLTLDDALDKALQLAAGARGPVVIADVSDNAGGGAPSDNTNVLRALLQRGIESAALAMMWDPIAVQMAFAAGEGATLRLRLGGKMGEISGDPLDETFTVTKLVRDAKQIFAGAPRGAGDCAALHVRGVDVVVNTVRSQVVDPGIFSTLGIPPAERRLLVVKSSQHFRAGFEPVAGAILYAAAPGAIMPVFDQIPFTRLDRPMWPIHPDLFDDQA